MSRPTAAHPAQPAAGTAFDLPTLAALIFTFVLWSSAFAVIRYAIRAYSPGHLALIRFLSASATLGLYVLLRRKALGSARGWPVLIAAGIVGGTLYHAFLNHGLAMVSAGAGSMVVNTAPVFATLLAAYFLRERVPLAAWLGLLVSLGGVVLIAAGEGRGPRLETGTALLLGSAICWALAMLFQKIGLRGQGPIQVGIWTVWIGTAGLLVFAPGLPQAVVRATWQATAAAIYLGVFPIGLAYLSWAYVLSRMPMVSVARTLYLLPALAVLFGWLLLGEVPTLLTLAGGALALAGVVLAHQGSAARPETE